jgi:uncharacterized protein (DUF302 family)
MKYYIATHLNTEFSKAVNKTSKTLTESGFGILSQIPIHEKIKEKLDVDFRNYMILGACNPSLAHQALQEDDKIGTMLPCNVIIQEVNKNKVEVAAVDPVVSMMGTENKELLKIADKVKERLSSVISRLEEEENNL